MPWWLEAVFHVGVWSFLAAGLIHLVLCGVLLVLDFPNRLHRAAALYLFLVGAGQVSRAFEGPGWPDAVANLGAYLGVGATFAIFYLAACYQDRFGGRRVGWVALAILLPVAALAELSLALRWPAWAFVSQRSWFGIVISVLQFTGLALVAWLFVETATSPGRSRTQARQLTLAAIALVFFPLAYAPHTWLTPLMPVPLRWKLGHLLAMLPALLVVVRLWRLANRDHPLRQTARSGLLILAVPLLTFGVLAVLNGMVRADGLSLVTAGRTMLVFMAFWPTATAVILTYAILRGEIFGAAAGLKWTISRGTVTGVLLAVFFVVAQLAEAFIGRIFGGSQWVLGGIGAGLALFAIQPLQRFAARVADRAMPGVKPVRDMSGRERATSYREQLEAAWSDGAINAKERRMLEVARAALGVPHEEAARLEQAVLHEAGTRAASGARHPAAAV